MKWNKAEDERLHSLVSRHGQSSWILISEQMDNRNPRQCRERWENYLRGGLRRSDWTQDEDLLLFQKYQELGAKWVQIAKFLPNRTDAMVKNRVNLVIRHQKKRAELLTKHDPLVFQMLQMSTQSPNTDPLVTEDTNPDSTQMSFDVDECDGDLTGLGFDDFLECRDPFWGDY
jgi:hypothetical protein